MAITNAVPRPPLPKSLMSLLSLPAEILGLICEEFCLHCKKRGSHRRYYFEIHEVYVPPENASLVALLRTCKLLYHIALPYLYHRPVGRKFFNLTQALVDRPDLGEYVQQISVTKAIAGIEPERLYGGHFNLICPFLEACDHMRDTALYQVARECKWLPLPKSLAQHFTLPELIFDDEYDTLFITMVLSMTPNLKKLEIGLWTYWKFPWCRPNSLLCLRELTITQWFTQKLSSTDDVNGLLAAAPNLERLKFVKVGQEFYDQSESNKPYLHHANVREITFKDCDIPTPNLKALMKGFPNLQTFRYGSRYWTKYHERNRKCFSRAMGQVVMLRKDTLRHLSLQLSNLRCPNLDRERLQDLSGMTVLETLHIDCTSLYREASSTPKVGLTICNLLPPSIKEFGLMGEVQEHLYEEVLELITTSRRTFPHLKKVIVAHYHHKVRWLYSGSSSSSDDGSSDDNSDESSDHGSDGCFDDNSLNGNSSDWINKLSSACIEHNIEFSSEKPSGWNGLFTEQMRYVWRRRR